jgi:hypothetical protein
LSGLEVNIEESALIVWMEKASPAKTHIIGLLKYNRYETICLEILIKNNCKPENKNP